MQSNESTNIVYIKGSRHYSNIIPTVEAANVKALMLIVKTFPEAMEWGKIDKAIIGYYC